MSVDWEMCQFWQNPQWNEHPTNPTDRMREPGWKWYSGFFSIGSTAMLEIAP